MLRNIGTPLLICLAAAVPADAGLFDCFCHDEPVCAAPMMDCGAPVYCEPMPCEPVCAAPVSSCAMPMQGCWGGGYDSGCYGGGYDYCPPPKECFLKRMFRHFCHDDDCYYGPPQYCPPMDYGCGYPTMGYYGH